MKSLDTMNDRFNFINIELSKNNIPSSVICDLSKELSILEPVILLYDKLKIKKIEKEDTLVFLEDSDLDIQELAKEDIKLLNANIRNLEKDIDKLLNKKKVDKNEDKNIILEIRAGAGGDEASIFAGELYNMYFKFSESKKFKIDIISMSEGSKGGYKEIIVNIIGRRVYSYFKYEAGIHRVQRIPETETQGRVHTSACSVAVLPEIQDIEIKIEDKDIRVDVFRAGGPGGQSVNTTDSAVRITHKETGLVVQCQDEKSQWKNKAKALKVLRARIFNFKKKIADEERSTERKSMIKSGDRSEKIRTYNFPQNRCTDHRAGFTCHNLPKLFSGDLINLFKELDAKLS